MSFDPIVASGANGALPHARPTNRKLASGDLIILDFGCFFDGYASDMTRTLALGTPSPEAFRVYSAVRDAQAEFFTHSLGHGIGLRIHEAPRIAATNDETLPDGAVVTIEPGVYIPGRFGVRIENAVILHPDGCEALTKWPYEDIMILGL